MTKNNTIKTLLSGCLLLLFVFSITPKIFLHDLIASHKDSWLAFSATETQISKKGFHCDCNSLVVVSPFLNDGISVLSAPLSFFVTHTCKLPNYFYSVATYVSSLRGPPTV